MTYLDEDRARNETRSRLRIERLKQIRCQEKSIALANNQRYDALKTEVKRSRRATEEQRRHETELGKLNSVISAWNHAVLQTGDAHRLAKESSVGAKEMTLQREIAEGQRKMAASKRQIQALKLRQEEVRTIALQHVRALLPRHAAQEMAALNREDAQADAESRDALERLSRPVERAEHVRIVRVPQSAESIRHRLPVNVSTSVTTHHSEGRVSNIAAEERLKSVRKFKAKCIAEMSAKNASNKRFDEAMLEVADRRKTGVEHDYFGELYHMDVNGERATRVKNVSMVASTDKSAAVTKRFESIFATDGEQTSAARVQAEAWSVPLDRPLVAMQVSEGPGTPTRATRRVAVGAWEVPSEQTERHALRQPALTSRRPVPATTESSADSSSASAAQRVAALIRGVSEPAPPSMRPHETRPTRTSPAALRFAPAPVREDIPVSVLPSLNTSFQRRSDSQSPESSYLNASVEQQKSFSSMSTEKASHFEDTFNRRGTFEFSDRSAPSLVVVSASNDGQLDVDSSADGDRDAVHTTDPSLLRLSSDQADVDVDDSSDTASATYVRAGKDDFWDELMSEEDRRDFETYMDPSTSSSGGRSAYLAASMGSSTSSSSSASHLFVRDNELGLVMRIDRRGAATSSRQEEERSSSPSASGTPVLFETQEEYSLDDEDDDPQLASPSAPSARSGVVSRGEHSVDEDEDDTRPREWSKAYSGDTSYTSSSPQKTASAGASVRAAAISAPEESESSSDSHSQLARGRLVTSSTSSSSSASHLFVRDNELGLVMRIDRRGAATPSRQEEERSSSPSASGTPVLFETQEEYSLDDVDDEEDEQHISALTAQSFPLRDVSASMQEDEEDMRPREWSNVVAEKPVQLTRETAQNASSASSYSLSQRHQSQGGSSSSSSLTSPSTLSARRATVAIVAAESDSVNEDAELARSISEANIESIPLPSVESSLDDNIMRQLGQLEESFMKRLSAVTAASILSKLSSDSSDSSFLSSASDRRDIIVPERSLYELSGGRGSSSLWPGIASSDAPALSSASLSNIQAAAPAGGALFSTAFAANRLNESLSSGSLSNSASVTGLRLSNVLKTSETFEGDSMGYLSSASPAGAIDATAVGVSENPLASDISSSSEGVRESSLLATDILQQSDTYALQPSRASSSATRSYKAASTSASMAESAAAVDSDASVSSEGDFPLQRTTDILKRSTVFASHVRSIDTAQTYSLSSASIASEEGPLSRDRNVVESESHSVQDSTALAMEGSIPDVLTEDLDSVSELSFSRVGDAGADESQALTGFSKTRKLSIFEPPFSSALSEGSLSDEDDESIDVAKLISFSRLKVREELDKMRQNIHDITTQSSQLSHATAQTEIASQASRLFEGQSLSKYSLSRESSGSATRDVSLDYLLGTATNPSGSASSQKTASADPPAELSFESDSISSGSSAVKNVVRRSDSVSIHGSSSSAPYSSSNVPSSSDESKGLSNVPKSSFSSVILDYQTLDPQSSSSGLGYFDSLTGTSDSLYQPSQGPLTEDSAIDASNMGSSLARDSSRSSGSARLRVSAFRAANPRANVAHRQDDLSEDSLSLDDDSLTK